MREAGPATWAWDEFGHANIEDHRWRQRLVSMAGRLARGPGGRVTETFPDDAERQGAYGLLESDAVSGNDVGAAMFAACAKRSAGEDYVFCPVDGTSLTLADRDGSKGFGPIGVRSRRGRGLKVMNTLVLTSQGVPLGISSQQWWARPERRRQKHRDQLPPEQKETGYWLESMKQTRQVMAEHAPGTRCWFQLDREGDAWPMLLDAGLDGHWFTIRACRKRGVLLDDGSRSTLRQVLAEQQPTTGYDLEVRATAKRQARTARMVVRACRVTLDFRDKRTSRRFSMAVNVVQALERDTTPQGEKPIEWTLLTNRTIATSGDLMAVVFGYSMRWRIEELHRTWKSGACRVEETQLRSPGAVIKWATILIAVAARIERIKQLSREQPECPATDEFSPVEIKAAALLRFGKPGNKRVADATAPTMAEVTLWIAQIGGYTGKTSSGGPPGATTLARGLERVRAAVQTLEALSSD
jgi:hypothetical protein